ncbi:unnamed protein product [Schistosoma mattheei]|uniref:Uncharacterized protein n=1 Tax=Schistosoma mattheei TaxID=31246 RepID=A0A183P2X5_9TREM|nr:unnamed protein product [Schistosoma mattheei]
MQFGGFLNLVCYFPQKAVADDIRPMDVEYLAQTIIYKYLYRLDDGCGSSQSFSSLHSNCLDVRTEGFDFFIGLKFFEFHMFFNCRNASLALPILAFTSVSHPPRSSMMLPRPIDAEAAATLIVFI